VLIRLTVLRHLRASPLRACLTVAGVALGVAAFTAIEAANESVLRSFRRAVDLVAGRATLQIAAGDMGIDERFFPTVGRLEGVVAAAPVIHAVAPVADRRGEALLILGVDLLAEDPFREYRLSDDRMPPRLADLLGSDAIFVTAAFASRHGLHVGDSLTLLVGSSKRRFVIKGLLAPLGVARAFDGNLAIMDIATAQAAFDKLGRLDRIDLVTRDGVPLETVIARAAAILPPHVTVQRPDRRSRQIETMISAFRLNLAALSAIALLVGLFLIYTAVSLSVIARRRQIGILRSLGLTRELVAALVATEGVMLGLIGSVLGIGGGLLLGQGLLRSVSRTISSLYAYLRVERLETGPGPLALAGAIGTLGALVASLAPAWAAGRVAPAAAMQPGSGERAASRRTPTALGIGLLLLAGSALCTRPGPVRGVPVFGYLSLACLIFGIGCLTPPLLRWAGAALHRLVGGRRAPLLLVAAGHIESHPGRNAVAVTAMMTAIAMFVGLTLMIGSFRRTVELWVDQTIRADLIASPAARVVKGSDATLPAGFVEQARHVAGVAAVDPFIGRRTELLGQEALLAAGDLDVVARYGRLLFRSGDPRATLLRAKASGGVVVSESLALTRGVREGDRLPVATPSGSVELPVVGVFYDYATDGGKAVMDRSLWTRLWDDDSADVVAIYLQPGADEGAVRRRLLELAGETGAIILTSNRSLKAKVLDIFDSTFRVARALELIAVLVAVLGIFTVLWASVVSRQREISLLRSIGATAAQVRGIVLTEAALLGLVIDLLGLIAGTGLSLILIHVINRQSFGWTIQFQFPPDLIVTSSILSLGTALGAGYLPARQAARTDIALGVAYDA